MPMDRTLHLVRLVVGSALIVIGGITLFVFFRARNVFEIRARSAKLVTLLGLAFLAAEMKLVELAIVNLYGQNWSIAWKKSTIYREYFLTFITTMAYVSRVIRLCVAYEPSFRRIVPWLLSENLLLCVCLSVGVLSMAIPLHGHLAIKGPTEEETHSMFEDEQEEHLWSCKVAMRVLECSLIPAVWMIDDIFNISRELMILIVFGITETVLSRLYAENAFNSVSRWINSGNFEMVSCGIVFWLSIANPVRRLIFHPMSGTRAAEIAENAKPCEIKEDIPGVKRTLRSDSGLEGGGSADNTPPGDTAHWNYEMIAECPALAAAFHAFAQRALCQESVCFLEEVARYKNGDYSAITPGGRGPIVAFEAIVKKFIVDGAPDEINISHARKKAILRLCQPGDVGLRVSVSDDQLRVVFDKAYFDIKFMLESNILQSFIDTDEFCKVTQTTRPPPTPSRRVCWRA